MDYGNVYSQSTIDYFADRSKQLLQAAPQRKGGDAINEDLASLKKEVAELHGSVSELLARIQPIMQPENSGVAGTGNIGNSKSSEPTSSELRKTITAIRQGVSEIAKELGGWRFRIEL